MHACMHAGGRLLVMLDLALHGVQNNYLLTASQVKSWTQIFGTVE